MYSLMLKDTEVLHFDLDECYFRVLNTKLLPFSIRTSDNIYLNKDNNKYLNRLQDFLSRRLFPLQRCNSKGLCTLIKLPQNNSTILRCKRAIELNALSLIDDYWVRETEIDTCYAKVALLQNPRDNIVDVALHGSLPSHVFEGNHADFSTDGMFAKAWYFTGDTYVMYKTDKTSDNINTKCELFASKFLDCFTNVRHVKYFTCVLDNTFCCCCDLIKRGNYSMLHCSELLLYCYNNNINYEEFMLQNFPQDFPNMCVIDYIIHNTDRHTDNYAFFMNNDSGDIKELAPLYDHNQSFVSVLLNTVDKTVLSQTLDDGSTMYDLLVRMLPKSNLNFSSDKYSGMFDKENVIKVYLDNILGDLGFI